MPISSAPNNLPFARAAQHDRAAPVRSRRQARDPQNASQDQ